MIVEYIRYQIDAARQADFVADYANAKEPLLASPYCNSFEISQCTEDKTQFILRIEWTSAEDHLQKFRGSSAFRQFFPHIKAYVGDILEMRHYEVL